MAIEKKSSPVLRGKEAKEFNKQADNNLAKKKSINFSKEAKIVSKILAKAKI